MQVAGLDRPGRHLARRPRRAAHLRRDRGRRLVRPRVRPCPGPAVADGADPPGRPGPARRDPRQARAGLGRDDAHARPLPPRRGPMSRASPRRCAARSIAYAAGVNAYIAAHAGALPPEFVLLGDRPEPWRPGRLAGVGPDHGAAPVGQLARRGAARRPRRPPDAAPARHDLAGRGRPARVSPTRRPTPPARRRSRSPPSRPRWRRSRRPTPGRSRARARAAASRCSPTTRISVPARRSSGTWCRSPRPASPSPARPHRACRSCCSATTPTSPGASTTAGTDTEDLVRRKARPRRSRPLPRPGRPAPVRASAGRRSG